MYHELEITDIHTKYQSGNLKGYHYLADVGVNEKKIIKLISER